MSLTTIDQIALFKASNTFSVVGIGFILTGQIIKGQIRAGDVLQIIINGVITKYVIDAVEQVDHLTPDLTETGLIFDTPTEDLKLFLEKSVAQTLVVLSS